MHRIDTPTAQKDKFGAGKNGFTRGNPQTGTPATDLDDDYFDMLQEELAGVVEASGVNLEKSKHNQLLTALKALLLSRAHPFADIKADGAAAIAEALSNLGLSDRLVFDISGTSIQSPNGRYTVFANDDGTWGAWDNVDKRQVPLDLTRGGFGGINAAEARTNLGLKAAAQRDVGTGAGQIPDMSSFGATKNGAGTFYLPNGIIVKWGTAQSTGTKGNAPYPTPFPNDTYAAIICHASASDSAHYTAGVMNPSRLGFDFSTAPTQSTGASFYYIAIGY